MIVATGLPFSGVEQFMNGLKPDFMSLTLKYAFDAVDVSGELINLYGDEKYNEYYAYLRRLDEKAVEHAIKDFKDVFPDGLWDSNYKSNHALFDLALRLHRTKKFMPVVRLPDDYVLAMPEKMVTKVFLFIDSPEKLLRRAVHALYKVTMIQSVNKFVALGSRALFSTSEYVNQSQAVFEKHVSNLAVNLPHLKQKYGKKLVIVDLRKSRMSKAALAISTFKKPRVPKEPALNDEGKTLANNTTEILNAGLKAEASQSETQLMKSGKLNIEKSKNWYCVRVGRTVDLDTCQRCINTGGDIFMDDQRILNREWGKYPCAYEVVYDLSGPRKTVEESISNHSWEVLP